MSILNEHLMLQLLLGCNALMLAAGALAILRFQRQARRFEAFWDSPTGLALADQGEPAPEVRVVADPALQERVAELQSAVSALSRRRPALSEPVAEARLPMENAMRMAKQGASIDDLVRSCGLNIGEAQLLKKLHGQAPAAATLN